MDRYVDEYERLFMNLEGSSNEYRKTFRKGAIFCQVPGVA